MWRASGQSNTAGGKKRSKYRDTRQPDLLREKGLELAALHFHLGKTTRVCESAW
jgi:hypothetical protein